MGSEQVPVNTDGAGADMEPWKKTPDSLTMVSRPELSLGLKRLDSVDKVTIDVGNRSVPRGRYIVTSSEEGLLLFKSTEFTSERLSARKYKRWEFQVHLLDPANQQVISLWRHDTSDNCAKMEVRVCGVLVAQAVSRVGDWMCVSDAIGKTVLKTSFAHPSASCYTGNYEFDLKTLKDEKIGSISKLCGRSVKQGFEDYKITFPEDMDVKYKAAVLGACILIDYMSFEEKVQ